MNPEFEALGDSCKKYEDTESCRRLSPRTPIIARLDGRAFHTFTKGLERPFDARLSRCMINTAKHLLEKVDPLLVYTQSDEITLVWTKDKEAKTWDPPFGGRVLKLSSVLAGMASSFFTLQVAKELPDRADRAPHFDCRVWNVPDGSVVADTLAWREEDAVRNSVTMLALSQFSHKQILNVGTNKKLKMLSDKGIVWAEYPKHFREGIYMYKRPCMKELTEEERLRIPEKNRPPVGHTFLRHEVVEA